MEPRTKVFIPLGSLLLAGIVSFLVYFFFSHAVPIVSLGQVAKGMPESQVRGLLGAPLCIRSDRPGSKAYFYGGFQALRWCTIEVYFGADGCVTGTFHDH